MADRTRRLCLNRELNYPINRSKSVDNGGRSVKTVPHV